MSKPTEKEKRKRIVLWSGGYDSTLALAKELEEYGNAEAWTIECDRFGLGLQQSAEATAMLRFKERAKKTKLKLTHNRVRVDMGAINPGGDCCMQSALFIPLSVYLAPKTATLIFGFHYKDDHWKYDYQFGLMRLYQSEMMDKDVRFENPLRGYHKYEIVEEIKEAGLTKCVWTCENPTRKVRACGKCEKCIALKLAKHEAILRKPKQCKR